MAVVRFFAPLCLVILAFVGSMPAQVYEGRELVRASLVAGATAVEPGKPLEVGLLLEMEPGWHTYWEYSGDAGLPTRITWTLPEGFVAGPIQWPAPEAKLEPGDIQTYAYSDRVLLITTIAVPADVPSGSSVTIRGRASWLVCKEICIPGSAELELTLPVASTSEPANVSEFEIFRAQIPSSEAPPYSLKWSREGGNLLLQVGGLPSGVAPELFPLPAEDQTVGHPAAVPPDGVRIAVDGDFRGVLAVGSGAARRAWYVQSPPVGGEAAVPSQPVTGLWAALFYGFLGGLILNLMPCVLPVISLKIFGFIRQAGEAPARIFAHGLAFAAGIFVWFLGLAALIIALKAGGTEVTWAFQFQNPWFNVVIGTVVFVFALNLAGVFEFVLPGQAATALEKTGSGEGLAPSFFQGIFATLLATPCTAPFLGTALGFAFSQPAGVILAMFASISAGMAFPYVLLSARPGWMRFLPQPGAWMEKLKQFMAFPLLATLVWLFSVLGGQRGTEAVIGFAAFLLAVGLVCWIYGSFFGPLGRGWFRFAALAAALVLTVWAGTGFLARSVDMDAKTSADEIAWIPFSNATVERLRSEDRPVFVDFT
ncbi:MAG: protein-disulfide reductase DsbD family protein, partial [Terrimicrobiaceae bacterium]|nr:protein-disulfide reductase DsbD family protein [Terrimicrobiaceae bacterium]